MLQCTIYAYNLEHKFKFAKVTSFEYWYLRLKETHTTILENKEG